MEIRVNHKLPGGDWLAKRNFRRRLGRWRARSYPTRGQASAQHRRD
jgi:hypothetical protein